jgi:hypothetical protein
MPLMIALSAMFFNSINASSIGYYLSNVSVYNAGYFIQWNFMVGFVLFVIGFIIIKYLMVF